MARKWLGRSAVLGTTVLAGVMVAGIAWARPANLNTSLDRESDQGVFRVQIKSDAMPIPMRRVHQWTIHLTDANGFPVSGAEIWIDGGMPQHRHGLPTAPQVTPATTPGDYVIKGVKFSMKGWWELNLLMTAPGGRADHITFNVVL